MKKVRLITAIVLAALLPAALFAAVESTAAGKNSTSVEVRLTISSTGTESYEIGFTSEDLASAIADGEFAEEITDVGSEGFVLVIGDEEADPVSGSGYVYWKLRNHEACNITLSAEGPLSDGTDSINFEISAAPAAAYVSKEADTAQAEATYTPIGSTESGDRSASYSNSMRIYSAGQNRGASATTHGYVTLGFTTEALTGHETGEHEATLTLKIESGA